MDKLKIVFAGGGTGGHVFPALNMARAIADRWDCEFLFFGTEEGLESVKVPEAGFNIKFIPVAGFQRKLTIKNFSFPWKLYKSMEISRQTLRKFDPDLVIGTGGYVMGPVLKAAQKLGIPTVLQEQNSYPGVTTRLLAKKAKLIFLGYMEATTHLETDGILMVTGNPVNSTIANESRTELCEMFGLDAHKKVILVFGGSQGAASINKAFKNMLIKNPIPKGFQILWQTGKPEYEEIHNFIREEKIANIRVRSFIDGMHRAYAIADLAVCRAGAMALSELINAGLPAILIPYPHAAADHQYKNAQALAQKQAAIVVRDDNHLEEKLAVVLERLAENENERTMLGRNMAKLQRKDTFIQILNALANLIKETVH